jgi:hypothetical protein
MGPMGVRLTQNGKMIAALSCYSPIAGCSRSRR